MSMTSSKNVSFDVGLARKRIFMTSSDKNNSRSWPFCSFESTKWPLCSYSYCWYCKVELGKIIALPVLIALLIREVQ
jgi:hypothetical protein